MVGQNVFPSQVKAVATAAHKPITNSSRWFFLTLHFHAAMGGTFVYDYQYTVAVSEMYL